MNDKLSSFQIIIFGVMILAIVGGVIVFALQRSETKASKIPITMWGTVDTNTFNALQSSVNDLQKDALNIIYTEYPADTFEDELIEALASGTGPDAAILSDEMLLRHENKLFTINYKFYPQQQFKDRFIEAGEVLLREEGILGLPLSIDPLVLYWNRTVLNNEGVTLPPRYWDDFLTLVPRLTKKDSTANVSRAAVALGEFDNVKNAKEILVTLIQQAGNSIVLRDTNEKKYVSVLGEKYGFALRPADTALNFFIQFSNPTKDVYTWNRALPMSDDMFLSGDLAFYFGFASEREALLQKNPNLNFDVSVIPQSRSSNVNSTAGRLQFVAILNKSEKISNAFTMLTRLTDVKSIEIWSTMTKQPSVRRDVATDYTALAYMDTFNRSALIAKSFIDPDPDQTNQIVKKMIESVVSGSSSVMAAIDRGNAELRELLK